MITSTQILTGTIGADYFTVGLAMDGSFALGVTMALALIYVVWLGVNKFQMWALTLVLIMSVLYAPFSVTPMAGYAGILVVFCLVVANFFKVFATLEVRR